MKALLALLAVFGLSLSAVGGCAGPPDGSGEPAIEPQTREPAAAEAAQGERPAPADEGAAWIEDVGGLETAPSAEWRAEAGGPAPPAESAPGGPGGQVDAEEWLRRGDQASAEGETAAAEQAYREAIRLDPRRADAHQRLAVVLRKLDRFDESLAASQEALRLRPDYGEALVNVGNIYYRRGDQQAALETLTKALKLQPDFAEGQLTLGVVLHATGDLEGAAAAYRRAIELHPTEAIAYSNLGIALDGMNDNDGALEAFQQAVRLDPSYAAAHNGLGKVLWQAGRRDEAIAAMREAVRLRPDFAVAHLNLISACFDLGEFEEAWKHVHLARELGSEPDPGRVAALADLMPDPYSQRGQAAPEPEDDGR